MAVISVLVGLLAGGAGPAHLAQAEIPALRAVQRIEGFPGVEDRAMGVRLYIAKDRLCAQRDYDQTLFQMRIDLDRIREIAPNRKTYREWIEFQNLQRERRIFEQQLKNTLSAELSGDQLDKALAQHHLRRDGKRIARVSEPEGEKAFTLGEGEYQKTHSARQMVVTENGRQILQAWYIPMPEDLAEVVGSVDFYEFYRRLGCFSTEVLEALRAFSRDHPGLPLEAEIRVITSTINYVFRARTLEFGRMGVSPFEFEIPTGAVRVDPQKAIVSCEWRNCSEQVETAAPPAKWLDYQKRWHYFCSTAHQTLFAKERIRLMREAAKKIREEEEAAAEAKKKAESP